MYGLDPNLDLSFLVACELIQVAVGEHEVILNFTSETSIMVASAVRLDGPNRDRDVIEDSRTAGAALLDLLGATIMAASGAAEGTLSLTRSDEHRLTIFDSRPTYESYTITHVDRTIIVWTHKVRASASRGMKLRAVEGSAR